MPRKFPSDVERALRRLMNFAENRQERSKKWMRSSGRFFESVRRGVFRNSRELARGGATPLAIKLHIAT